MKRMILALAALFATAAFAQHGINWHRGDSAPKFTAQEMDGKLRSIKEFENEGAFFLYFVRDDDPVDNAARGYINKMVSTYVPARAKWYGVVQMNHDRAVSWNAEYAPPYHVLLDTEGKLQRLFRVTASPTIIEIGVGGDIRNVWTGYSGYWLKDLNREMASINHAPLQAFDFTKTPSVTQYGRTYGSER